MCWVAWKEGSRLARPVESGGDGGRRLRLPRQRRWHLGEEPPASARVALAAATFQASRGFVFLFPFFFFFFFLFLSSLFLSPHPQAAERSGVPRPTGTVCMHGVRAPVRLLRSPAPLPARSCGGFRAGPDPRCPRSPRGAVSCRGLCYRHSAGAPCRGVTHGFRSPVRDCGGAFRSCGLGGVFRGWDFCLLALLLLFLIFKAARRGRQPEKTSVSPGATGGFVREGGLRPQGPLPAAPTSVPAEGLRAARLPRRGEERLPGRALPRPLLGRARALPAAPSLALLPGEPRNGGESFSRGESRAKTARRSCRSLSRS